MNAPSPHPSPVELADYAARRLPAAEVLRLSDHLAACADCHSALARLRPPTARSPDAFLIEPADTVPSFDDLAGELDSTLPPARHAALTAELARSVAARDALADLAAFRDELAGLPPKHHRAGGLSADQPTASDVHKVVVPPPWRWRTAAAWATGLAALLMALAMGSWMFTRHNPRPEDLLRDANGRTADLSGLPTALRGLVEMAARTGQLPPGESTLATRREVLAGQTDGVQMAVVSPVATVVRERQPALHWTPRDEATGYVVSCASMIGGPLLTSPLLPAGQTQWVPPEALQRGAIYQWQVEALRGETVIDRAPKPPAGEARFQVLDAASDDQLEKIEKEDGGFPLVLGVTYWRAGLAATATDQFHRLAREHTRSVVAQRLEHVADPVTAR